MGQLFEELKRRNVFRVAIAYVVAAWLVLQVAEFILEVIEAPAWVMQVFMLAFALGFPLVLLFSWAYELTPQGLKKEKDVDRGTSITPETGRKLDMATIGMLVGVIVLFGVERTFFRDAVVVQEPASASATVDENSIAVLAFEDLSPGGDHGFFADGLSEEILNVLAKVDHLKVAGRTSSFAFKGQNRDLREIGDILEVAHILEGSVRKAGDRIRVTAQLIEASSGFHLYSDTFDRDLDDVFAVQDEIAAKISQALLTEITDTEAIVKATETDPVAYEMYLEARQRLHTRDFAAMQEASTMLDRALEIDPNYAPALAQKAMATYLLSDALGAYGDIPVDEATVAAHRLVDRALALDDQQAESYAVLGLLQDEAYEYENAIASLTRALEINPTLSDAGNWLANALSSVNRDLEARAYYEAIVDRDPLYGPAFNNLIIEYARTAAFDKANTLTARVERITGFNDEVAQAYGMSAVMSGDNDVAVENMHKAWRKNPSATVTRMWYGFALRAIGEWEQVAERGSQMQQIHARAILASDDELDGIVAEFQFDRGFPPRTLRYVGELYGVRHRHQDFVDFIEREFGSLDDLLHVMPMSGWFAEYGADLAFSYLQIGNEDAYRKLLAAIGDNIEQQRKLQTNNWVQMWGEAQYAALRGDRDELIEKMRTALGLGLVRVDAYDSPMFDAFRDDPEFRAIISETFARIDRQRANLGLPPYRPIEATEDTPSSFVN